MARVEVPPVTPAQCGYLVAFDQLLAARRNARRRLEATLAMDAMYSLMRVDARLPRSREWDQPSR